MHKTLEVAWREFKSTALTKAFLVAALFAPVIMIIFALLGPYLFNPKPAPLKGTIALVDPDGTMREAVAIEFAPEKIRERIRGMAREREEAVSGLAEAASIDPQLARNPRSISANTVEFDIDLKIDDTHGSADVESLKSQLAAGDLVALVTLGDQPTTQPAATAPSAQQGRFNATIYVPATMNIKHTGLIEDLVQAAAGRAKIGAAGLDVQTVRDLARAPEPTTIRLGKTGSERTEGKDTKVFKIMVPMAFMMLLWMGAFVSANYLLTTTIEEKSNKVMEVLLSAVSPMQLMAGKIIGQAAVGMVMVGMYLAMGVAALVAMATVDLIDWTTLIYFALYFVMAYFMIASIMAAIGSAVNELREAQSLMTPAMIVLIIPLMLWLPISTSPNGLLATITSLIPPLIPFVMILRVSGDEPIPAWQIIASFVIGFPAMLGMVWMAARVFRVGVLMYGKPPSPLELIKWVRYS